MDTQTMPMTSAHPAHKTICIFQADLSFLSRPATPSCQSIISHWHQEVEAIEVTTLNIFQSCGGKND